MNLAFIRIQANFVIFGFNTSACNCLLFFFSKYNDESTNSVYLTTLQVDNSVFQHLKYTITET